MCSVIIVLVMITGMKVVPPVIEKQQQMQDAVNALMEQVRGGDLTPQEALDQAKTEIEALLA